MSTATAMHNWKHDTELDIDYCPCGVSEYTAMGDECSLDQSASA